MDNINKIGLRHLLVYNPYDTANSYEGVLCDDDFKNVRHIPIEFKTESEILKSNLGYTSLTRFYVVSGYSGNGKTTFIHWFKEEMEKSDQNIYFEIINLINKGYNGERDMGLMAYSLKDRLKCDLIDNEVITIIANNRDIFSEIFTKEQLNSFCKIKTDNLTIENINYFLEEFCFKDILILFLLQRVMQFTSNSSISNKQTYTFCFDNLDEIGLEYLTEEMWTTIRCVCINIMPDIIRSLNIPFSFALRIKFLLVFREANLATSSAQLNDRLNPFIVVNKRFILIPFLGKEIVMKRIEYYEKLTKNVDSHMIKWFNVILDDDKVVKIILPLFNYDYRKFVEVTISIIDKYFKDFSSDNYAKIPSNGYIKYGKRGIILNAFIRYLSINNYIPQLARITPLDPEKAHCNNARLMLTIFSNLSYGQIGLPKEDKELHEAKPNPFTLIKAYDSCKEVLSIQDFFRTLEVLIDLNKSSWAHLITIYGKKPVQDGNKIKFDFREEIAILGKYYDNNGVLSIDELITLNNISFSLDASSYIYLRDILPHFEYISSYKAKGYDEWKQKPLFQLVNIDIKEMQWEFQIKMNEVFQHVETYRKNIQKHFDEMTLKINTIVKNKEDYVKSNYVFRGEKSIGEDATNAPLYMTRLITKHITYIEAFRHYITTDGYSNIQDSYNKIDVNIRTNLSIYSVESINSYILNIIKKYLDEMEKLKDPTQKNVLEDLKESLSDAEKDHSKWIER
jgi:hypothetical protein